MLGQATWFADPSAFPAWEYAGEAGIPVCMQMTPQGFPQLRGLMDRFPKVRIILDHLARPQLTDGPPFAADQPFFDLAKYGQVFLKVTPVNVEPKEWGKATPALFFGEVVKTFGAARIAWGSNFPATPGPLSAILRKAQDAFSFASAEDREWIFGKTAMALYPKLAD
jgi:predicted TIM-barrel fold metal-dependent hydrolase